MPKANETEIETSANANAKLMPLLDKPKLKVLRDSLGGDRTRFKTTDEGVTAYEQLESLVLAAMEKTKETPESDAFFGLPFLIRQGSESAPITTADEIILATVGVRDKASGVNGIKAIVAFESPSVASFIASETDNVAAFVSKVIERESTDVAFSALRAPDMTLNDLENAVSAMPASVDEIVNTSRDSTGVDTDAFDTLWTSFKAGVLKEKAPKLLAALPTKAEVQKAIRSASYAMANPATRAIEEKGLFVKMATLMIGLAPNFLDDKGQPDPVDPASIQAWLDERATLNLQFTAKTVDADSLELSF